MGMFRKVSRILTQLDQQGRGARGAAWDKQGIQLEGPVSMTDQYSEPPIVLD